MIEKTRMKSIYERLADLLEYPGASWCSLIESCGELAAEEIPESSGALSVFREAVTNLSLSELQEVYTRTFDLSPVCALDIGYHLFGENYKRGVFLASLRETEAPFDLGQEHQLPDYLPVLLRLLTKLDDEELRSALIVDCMIPALEKMLKTLGEGENPYRHLIAAIEAALKSEGLPQAATPRRAYLPVLDDAGWNHAPAPEARQMVAPGVSPGITIERIGRALEEGDRIA
jgi:nitrate reductase molybdenum cofactor assembly chaperone